MMRRRRRILRGAMVGGIYAAGKADAKRAASSTEQERQIEGPETTQGDAAPGAAVGAGAAEAEQALG